MDFIILVDPKEKQKIEKYLNLARDLSCKI